MVLMRARDNFEALENRYSRKLPNTGIRSGITTIMTCQMSKERVSQLSMWEDWHEATHEVDREPELQSRGKEGTTGRCLEPSCRKGCWRWKWLIGE